MLSLGLPDDLELSGFLVTEQELVDLKRIVCGLVLVLYEPRLVVPECQYPVHRQHRSEFILLSINDNVQRLSPDVKVYVLAGSAALRLLLLRRLHLRPPRPLCRRDFLSACC